MLQIIACFGTMAVAKHAGEYFLRLAGERAIADVRNRLFGSLVASELATLDETPTAHKVSVLTADVEAIHQSLTLQLPLVLRNLCMCLISGAHMLSLSPRLTALGASVAPLIGLLASAVGRVVSRLARQQQQQLASSTAVAFEALASARCVKAFGQEPRVCERYAAEVSACRVLAMRESARD